MWAGRRRCPLAQLQMPRAAAGAWLRGSSGGQHLRELAAYSYNPYMGCHVQKPAAALETCQMHVPALLCTAGGRRRELHLEAKMDPARPLFLASCTTH